MNQNIRLLPYLVVAAAIRYLLITSKYSEAIQNRIEVSTPLNSWKRVKEGAFLYANGIDPYQGDIYHENPLILVATNFLIQNFNEFIPFLFIAMDILTSIFLYFVAQKTIKQLFNDEKTSEQEFADEAKEIRITDDDVSNIPIYCLIAYLFNPYSILNCVGQTMTVWSNLLLAVFFFGVSRRIHPLSCLALALETQRNFYPVVLLAAAIVASRRKLLEGTVLVTLYTTILGGLYWTGYHIMGNGKFIDSTIGFVNNHRDLQPNIGLFWYFFMEMFDHFRMLFLYTFQINATILYLLPLAFKLRKNPMLLITMLTALMAIFRSYPCVGDVALYMALIPIWKPLSKFMSHNFIVAGTFLVTSILAPVVWHLWIYSSSANANFYFGVTLVFATAQIFLITDLFFANIKREFCLRNGTTFKLKDGREAKLALE